MRGFVIAMASLAFIGGLSQGGTEPVAKPKPSPPVVQPFNPTVLPPVEACDCAAGGKCECDPCKCRFCKTANQAVAADPLTGISVSKPTVIMISASWCAPCQGFKKGPMPGELRAKGWDFVIDESQTAKVRLYPTYRIYDGVKWVQVEGVLTGSKMQAALNPKPVGPIRRVLQNSVSSVSYQQPSSDHFAGARNMVAVEGYVPRWVNYDGKSRMQHAVEDHGIDIRGKSEAQVLREMDAYHNRYGGGHAVKYSNVVQSGCPGGSCPPQRRSFFARR
jgi:hypothetical protein